MNFVMGMKFSGGFSKFGCKNSDRITSNLSSVSSKFSQQGLYLEKDKLKFEKNIKRLTTLLILNANQLTQNSPEVAKVFEVFNVALHSDFFPG